MAIEEYALPIPLPQGHPAKPTYAVHLPERQLIKFTLNWIFRVAVEWSFPHFIRVSRTSLQRDAY